MGSSTTPVAFSLMIPDKAGSTLDKAGWGASRKKWEVREAMALAPAARPSSPNPPHAGKAWVEMKASGLPRAPAFE